MVALVFRRTVLTPLDGENGSKDAATQLSHSRSAITEKHYSEKAATALEQPGAVAPTYGGGLRALRRAGHGFPWSGSDPAMAGMECDGQHACVEGQPDCEAHPTARLAYRRKPTSTAP